MIVREQLTKIPLWRQDCVTRVKHVKSFAATIKVGEEGWEQARTRDVNMTKLLEHHALLVENPGYDAVIISKGVVYVTLVREPTTHSYDLCVLFALQLAKVTDFSLV